MWRPKMDLTINTGLKGKKYYDILASVIGQLSDGIWENTPSVQRYWQEQDIKRNEADEVFIVSHYLFEDEEACKKYFAHKVKQIVKIERDDGETQLEWRRDNDNATCYISNYGDEDYDIVVGDIYFVYDTLLGRDTSKYSYARGWLPHIKYFLYVRRESEIRFLSFF